MPCRPPLCFFGAGLYLKIELGTQTNYFYWIQDDVCVDLGCVYFTPD